MVVYNLLFLSPSRRRRATQTVSLIKMIIAALRHAHTRTQQSDIWILFNRRGVVFINVRVLCNCWRNSRIKIVSRLLWDVEHISDSPLATSKFYAIAHNRNLNSAIDSCRKWIRCQLSVFVYPVTPHLADKRCPVTYICAILPLGYANLR